MQTLYSQTSYEETDRRIKRRFLILAAVLVVLLAETVWAFIARKEIVAIVAVCVAGCFAVFFTDLFCMPLVRYRRLIRSALSGRSHETTLEYSRAETDLSVVDGVRCHSLIFLGDPDKHGSRDMLFYWDAEIPLPSFVPGRFYTLVYTGKTIIGWSDPAA